MKRGFALLATTLTLYFTFITSLILQHGILWWAS